MHASNATDKEPVLEKSRRIAVIGAGISGLFAARTLIEHGHRVQVFEKSGRPGGRTAARSAPPYAFDGGAQYFTVRDERLHPYVRSWHLDGIVALWNAKVAIVKDGQISDERRPTERWVGTPAMESVAAHLAARLDIAFDTAVTAVKTVGNRWQLIDKNGLVHEPFQAVIIASPPPSATAIIDLPPEMRDHITGVRMQPCLAVMVAFDKPLDLPFDGAFVHDAPVRWMARNSSKQMRPAAECWVFHADARWSEDHAERSDDEIVNLLVGPLLESLGHPRIEPVYCSTRYWKYAAAANPMNTGCLWDGERKIGLCGDWCQMSRFEGAILSGMSMAGRILGMGAGVAYGRKDANP